MWAMPGRKPPRPRAITRIVPPAANGYFFSTPTAPNVSQMLGYVRAIPVRDSLGIIAYDPPLQLSLAMSKIADSPAELPRRKLNSSEAPSAKPSAPRKMRQRHLLMLVQHISTVKASARLQTTWPYRRRRRAAGFFLGACAQPP